MIAMERKSRKLRQEFANNIALCTWHGTIEEKPWESASYGKMHYMWEK